MNISKKPPTPRVIGPMTAQVAVQSTPATSSVSDATLTAVQQPTEVDSVKPAAKIRSAKLALFVEEYLNANFNGTKAAIAVGYSRKSARVKASELLTLPEVNAAIEASMVARAERIAVNTDDIVRRMHAIAFADPRELIEVHRYGCRYCYGKDHRYQWTPNELRDAEEAFATRKSIADGEAAMRSKSRPPDVAGGLGFNRCADPHPACPECFGDGVVHVVAKDTRDLSPMARLLYAGAKKTPSGVEIKMNDQSAMLTNLARHLGMFTTNISVAPCTVTITPWATAADSSLGWDREWTAPDDELMPD